MKKLLFAVAISLLFTSCASLRSPVVLSSTLVDYNIYTKQGFFFTESNSVSFEYKPLGSVAAEFISGYEILGQEYDKTTNDDLYRAFGPVKTSSKFIFATQQGVVDQLFKQAKKLGANAIINLKINSNGRYDEKTGRYLIGYAAYGMAITK